VIRPTSRGNGAIIAQATSHRLAAPSATRSRPRCSGSSSALCPPCGKSSSLPRLRPLQHRHERYAECPRQVRQVVEADGLLATLDLAEEFAGEAGLSTEELLTPAAPPAQLPQTVAERGAELRRGAAAHATFTKRRPGQSERTSPAGRARCIAGRAAVNCRGHPRPDGARPIMRRSLRSSRPAPDDLQQEADAQEAQAEDCKARLPPTISLCGWVRTAVERRHHAVDRRSGQDGSPFMVAMQHHLVLQSVGTSRTRRRNSWSHSPRPLVRPRIVDSRPTPWQCPACLRSLVPTGVPYTSG
jgi:hypothetical protein